jgi:hypothetical protein
MDVLTPSEVYICGYTQHGTSLLKRSRAHAVWGAEIFMNPYFHKTIVRHKGRLKGHKTSFNNRRYYKSTTLSKHI